MPKKKSNLKSAIKIVKYIWSSTHYNYKLKKGDDPHKGYIVHPITKKQYHFDNTIQMNVISDRIIKEIEKAKWQKKNP